MTSSPRIVRVTLGFSLLLAVTASAALAQAAGAPDPGSRDARRAAVNASLPEEFGPLCCSILQIPAAACQNFQTFWSPAGGGYLYPVDPGSSYCWAPVELPTGVVVTFIDLYYDDTDASSDVDAALLLDSGYSSSVSTLLQSVASNGSAGKGYVFSSPFSHTVNNEPGSGGGQYMVRVLFNPSSPGSQGFKGVDLWYYRQVSPAPATATFNDVPTNHPFFQFIEAIAAAGITAGCGGGNFCPDQPITRKQEAAFIAKALGLYWQY
jgi:hypothetical protein